MAKKDKSEDKSEPVFGSADYEMTAEDYDRSDTVPPAITPGREFADIDGADPKWRDGKDGPWKVPELTNVDDGWGNHYQSQEGNETELGDSQVLHEGTSDANGNFVGESDEHLSEGDQ